MKVKTTNARQVWQSPDKQRTIWEVSVEDESGKKWPLQTYSEEIAKVGFAGEVETYDKNGKKFVKQPNTGGGYKGGGSAARAQADALKQKEIRAEWAIGKAITSLGIFPLDDDALGKVQELAGRLYTMVETVISSQSKAKEDDKQA